MHATLFLCYELLKHEIQCKKNIDTFVQTDFSLTLSWNLWVNCFVKLHKFKDRYMILTTSIFMQKYFHVTIFSYVMHLKFP